MHKIYIGRGINGEDKFKIEVYKKMIYTVFLEKNGKFLATEDFWDMEEVRNYINTFMPVFKLEKFEK